MTEPMPVELGPLIAQGRSADIYEYGDGRVLRRRKLSASIPAHEPVVMRAVRADGFPAPQVFSVDGGDMVMQRIVGVNMLKVLERRPWLARRFGSMLADLHVRLAAIEPDPDLVASGVVPTGYGPPAVFVHGDLHPMNVIVTASGPVVIDWEGTRLGPRDADVAATWLLLTIGEPDDVPTLIKPLVRSIRSQLLRTFLAGVQRPTPATIRAVCDARMTDRNMKPVELERIEQFRERYG